MGKLEEMVIRIQNGEKSLIPEAWERIRRIYEMKAYKYYASHRTLCARCGVELDDIKQQSYFAFLRSIEAYEPQCELAFSSYINYPFMIEMQELTYTRHSGQQADCLNKCSSLDLQIETEDGGGDTVGDFVPDPAALDFLELLDAQSVGAMIRREVQQLPDREREVIAGVFFDGLTLSQLAERLGITFQRVSQLKKRGLYDLSRRRVLVDLWNEMHHTAKIRELERAARSSTPENYASARRYEHSILCHDGDSPLDKAFRHADELRKSAEAAGQEWTREQQIAAIVKYLQPDPVKA